MINEICLYSFSQYREDLKRFKNKEQKTGYHDDKVRKPNNTDPHISKDLKASFFECLKPGTVDPQGCDVVE